ncbi:hypothetical protein EYF80_045334 [Liparis tanakae]|uniref:Uncharacterized protein n=1 Tax=Liparis tanakae TaxID=230148 RepID=A0A4Z2FT99_9TELE|nr:hypothetical protein EYF80_045334 [Liparis tanakae]
MVTPKPHWNLFFWWLRKVQSTRESGSGSSFFSSVAPTTQLLSTEPGGDEKPNDTLVSCMRVLASYSTPSCSCGRAADRLDPEGGGTENAARRLRF